MSDYRTWREVEIEHFRAHPDEIPEYLGVAFEEAQKDGQWGAFMIAVRTATEARGGVGALAERLGCSRTSLYKTLSARGNPRIDTLEAILGDLGCRLVVRATEPVRKRREKKRNERFTTEPRRAQRTHR